MPADRAGSAPPDDPLGAALARAAESEPDADVRRWLAALSQGDRATSRPGREPAALTNNSSRAAQS